MHIIYNALLNTYMKETNFYLIVKRLIRNTTLVKNNLEVKPKGKITVVKRKFQENKQSSTALEWKSATDVIKKLNWENKHLYGPVQTSKTNSHAIGKIVDSQIIQHETRIPIIEPSVDHNDIKKSIEANDKEQKNDLHSILTFPLVNKSVYSTSKINELNYLRKHLEFRTKMSTFPSVTLILQKTIPIERVDILNKWKQNMISQLGQEGFEKYQTELFANGASLHHSISSFLSSTPKSELHIKEENSGHWMSLKHVFPYVKDVKLLEEFVTHPFLCYRGVVDCFAKYKDHLVVIDWKTSKKSKTQIKNTYDDPLQIAAYVGALNFDPKFHYLAHKGLIVVAYESGISATVHFIDEYKMQFYWKEWLKRVKQFWEMQDSETKNS